MTHDSHSTGKGDADDFSSCQVWLPGAIIEAWGWETLSGDGIAMRYGESIQVRQRAEFFATFHMEIIRTLSLRTGVCKKLSPPTKQ
jgi:hypothetical protein